MPSLSYSSADFTITPGTIGFIPDIFSYEAAAFTFAGGNIELELNTDGSRTSENVKLPRMQRQFPMTDAAGFPTVQTHAYWQEFADTIERAFSRDREQIGENARILDLIQTLLGISTQTQIELSALKDANALSESYTNPVQTLTAYESGEVVVADHQRIYGDGTAVDVTGGIVQTEASEGEVVAIYYFDAAREGGSVDYQSTTGAIAQTGVTHVVGQVTVPATGEPGAPGYGPTAPGYYPPSDGFGPGGGQYEFVQ